LTITWCGINVWFFNHLVKDFIEVYAYTNTNVGMDQSIKYMR